MTQWPPIHSRNTINNSHVLVPSRSNDCVELNSFFCISIIEIKQTVLRFWLFVTCRHITTVYIESHLSADSDLQNLLSGVECRHWSAAVFGMSACAASFLVGALPLILISFDYKKKNKKQKKGSHYRLVMRLSRDTPPPQIRYINIFLTDPKNKTLLYQHVIGVSPSPASDTRWTAHLVHFWFTLGFFGVCGLVIVTSNWGEKELMSAWIFVMNELLLRS